MLGKKQLKKQAKVAAAKAVQEEMKKAKEGDEELSEIASVLTNFASACGDDKKPSPRTTVNDSTRNELAMAAAVKLKKIISGKSS